MPIPSGFHESIGARTNTVGASDESRRSVGQVSAGDRPRIS